MERTNRDEKNDALKAKLIFLSLAALVVILLVGSFYWTAKARSERDAALAEVELIKRDNAKLEQMVKELNQYNEELRKKVQQAQVKPKPKAPAKKKTTKTTTKKSSKTSGR